MAETKRGRKHPTADGSVCRKVDLAHSLDAEPPMPSQGGMVSHDGIAVGAADQLDRGVMPGPPVGGLGRSMPARLRMAVLADFAQCYENRRYDVLFRLDRPTAAARPRQHDFFRKSGQIIVTHGVANEMIAAYASRSLTGSPNSPANLRHR